MLPAAAPSLEGLRAHSASIIFLIYSLFFLFVSGQELRPQSLDIRQEELGDMVDKEMASTSAAIEDAVRRIEVRWPTQGARPLPWQRRALGEIRPHSTQPKGIYLTRQNRTRSETAGF